MSRSNCVSEIWSVIILPPSSRWDSLSLILLVVLMLVRGDAHQPRNQAMVRIFVEWQGTAHANGTAVADARESHDGHYRVHLRYEDLHLQLIGVVSQTRAGKCASKDNCESLRN